MQKFLIRIPLNDGAPCTMKCAASTARSMCWCVRLPPGPHHRPASGGECALGFEVAGVGDVVSSRWATPITYIWCAPPSPR